jgi:hypothetical protein
MYEILKFDRIITIIFTKADSQVLKTIFNIIPPFPKYNTMWQCLSFHYIVG